MILDKTQLTLVDGEAPELPPKQEVPVYPASQAGGSTPSDEPPPYAGPSTQTHQGPSGAQRHNSHLQSVAEQEVNYIALVSKNNSISGSYMINTELPQSDMLTRCKWGPLDKANKKMYGKRNKGVPNASVHTRHGAIALNLATGGQSSAYSKAHVQVSSRHGKVHVNIYSIQENKHICLEVSTRHGNIVVFVPPTFAGALQLRTRRGNVQFLPEFERNARLLNASDKGALVLFGQNVQNPVIDMHDLISDSCMLSTRHGRIVIGVSGVDHYDEVQGPNLLEKLGSLSMLFLGRDVTKPMQEMQRKMQEAAQRF
ncbi:hypothetical protein EIP91_002195 [Steccherinum ochraceum]|uniref:DUF7330 domain-containing protein n=1 Tax=Steccherinum ochraceum TaxID=92696 RepID=A0A4R0RER8_9APHY|nr:hypothetical protein EIP91_002195 [Steccherinum ochraceum]